MKFVLFTTKIDKGGQAIEKEAKRMSLPCQTYFCEELVYKNGEIFNSSLNPLSINRDDKIILRDPYNTKSDYSFFTKKILKKYYKNISLDKECYSRFPFYEDKLFQTDLFIKLGITTPETFLGKNINRLLKFPVIVKPRIGSRGRGIRIFNELKETESFFAEKDLLDYIVQKYHKAKKEYRILLLRHKILGVVDKHIHLKNEGKVGVRTNKVVNDLPMKIKQDAIRITEELKADFVGIDVIHIKDGGYYFLEANLSPQFNAFAKATGINIASMVIRLALT